MTSLAQKAWQFLKVSWRGNTPLWQVFWLCYLGIRIVYVAIFLGLILLVKVGQDFIIWNIYIAAIVAFWQWNILWHNAKNSSMQYNQYIIKAIVITEIMAVIWLAEFMEVT